MANKPLKFIELFAGIGGFGLALTRQGHACVYANEWDKYAAQIYEKNFGTKPDTKDIRTVPTSEIPDHDLLCGGFPCQAFSIAGKRKGFDDTRGTLFFEIARILRDKKTRLFLLENVKGLLSHDSGNTFKTIISTLTELGYDLQWQVLNSKNFGVPQNRERVFIIGHLRGTSRPKVFPITQNNSEDIVLPTITTRITADSNGTYVSKRQTQEIKQLNNPTHSNNRIYGNDGISPTLNTAQGGNRQPKIYDDYNSKWREDNISCTLTPNTGSKSNRNGQKLLHQSKIRRLTPTECERLQGFPDGWTEDVSNTQRYKCLGNAVTVNVVEYIISLI